MKTGKVNIAEYLAWLPALLVMAVILILSSQSGDVSLETSSSVAVLVADKTRLEVDFNDIWKQEHFDALNNFIRTAAHMAEYAVFALCVAFAVSINGFRGKMRFIYSFLVSAALSVFDEFYQIFVPGRYGDLIDIFFDSVSAFAVVLFVYVVEKLVGRKRKDTAGVEGGRIAGTALKVSGESFPDEKKESVDMEASKKRNWNSAADDGILLKNNSKIAVDRKILLDRCSGRKYRRRFMSSSIDSIDLTDVLEIFKGWILQKSGLHYIVTPNADHMVKLEKNERFRSVYEEADLILTDGQPLMWIADSLGNPIAEKIPGSDLLPYVCEIGAELKAGLFILGTRDEIAKEAAKKLKEKYKGLRIAGTYSPDMGFEKNMEQQREAIERINKSGADILVLALGSPKQEYFMYDNRDKIKVSLVLPIGAAIDFAAGAVKRAPKWMRRSGLEWLYRFLQEPGRLFRRYFVDDMKIFLLAWKYRHQIRKD